MSDSLLSALETVGSREDVPPVDESPTAHPDRVGDVLSLSILDEGGEAVVGVTYRGNIIKLPVLEMSPT